MRASLRSFRSGWCLVGVVVACGSPTVETGAGESSETGGAMTTSGASTSGGPGETTLEGPTGGATMGDGSDTGVVVSSEGSATTGDACPESAEGCPCGPGGLCDGGLECDGGTCVPAPPGVCGDGVVGRGEACDDGPNNGDTKACTASCEHATCGDGLVGPGEGCDDANDVDDDACTNACVPASCGDGVVGPDEACDDGNRSNEDACTAACSPAACGDEYVQAGEQETCDEGVDNSDHAACTSECLFNVCGDGKPFNGEGGAEECDDGPANGPGQVCTAGCLKNVCGDGDKGPGEQCDDGDLEAGDGCSSGCVLEDCGNGAVDPGEGCDDGADGDNDDGCTDACQAPACGDGFVQASLGEACDDGNGVNTDACTTACAAAACGDGYVQAGEGCDDGNGVNTDACVAGCEPAGCGDGYVHAGVEACDDGNANDADGCTQACMANDGVVALDASLYTTCALLAGGAVKCWGGGVLSQLGIPNNGQAIGDDEHPAAFPAIQLGGPAIDLAAGANHNCVVLQGGAVRCWGSGMFGRLGLANTQQVGDNEHPADAPTLKLGGTAVDVTTYHSHTCAVLVGGAVRCWGNNLSYQLGLGNMSSQSVGDNEHPDGVPPVMIGGTGVATATGSNHSCALLATGQMRCWGSGSQGQLGLGNSLGIGYDEVPADSPPVVFTEVEDLSAGDRFNCFRRPGGAVHCFGANEYGQLGLGHVMAIGDTESPDVGPIQLGSPAIDVDAGGRHACAVLQGGAVRCWGQNEFGQLGLGHTNNIGDDELPTAAPTVQLGGPAVRVSAGGSHTCALMATGGVRCWGLGMHGNLGYANKLSIGDDEHPEVAGEVQVF